MQAISLNRITQGQHGTSKAVDYDNDPDPTIYAPEDGLIQSYGQQGQVGTINDAGLALMMNGGSGTHLFAHTERSLVSVGQYVKRGQPLAIMGYTGYTVPKGSAGAHCHWWIKRADGTYVYPPNLINETFIKQGGETMNPTAQQVKDTIKGWLKYDPSQSQINVYTSNPWWVLMNDVIGAYGDIRNRASEQDTKDYFATYLKKQPTKQQLDYYKERGWRTLMDDIIPTYGTNISKPLQTEIDELKKQLEQGGTLPSGTYLKINKSDIKEVK